ncbi:MAG TPA: FHA domain-containing protein [Thermoanaerobaculia bacterium]|nr:FHA domain-containing protein [Thermoanaerobaculia bacterium]
MSRSRLVGSLLVALALVGGGGLWAAAGPAVVVAVDTSRSLDAATLAQMGETASAALGGLPAETKVGVLAFDDAPRWVLRGGSPAEASAALASLRPSGSYTLLDDALFTAARELGRGGVVLLLTDGRDENSATTVEDVARACEARGVRVVGVGAGKRLDERRMRRLALLTGGSYVGPLASVKPAAVGAALVEAASTPVEAPVAKPAEGGASGSAPSESAPSAPLSNAASSSSSAASSQPSSAAGAPLASGNVPVSLRTPPGDNAPTADASAPDGSVADSSLARRWWWLALPLALVAIAVPVAAMARRRAGQRTTVCKRCGKEVPAGEDCPHCAAADSELALQERLRNRDLTRLEDTSELRLDQVNEVITGVVDLDAIEKTRVIADQSMLMVREPGESQRSFLLRSDGAFAVGRDPRTNTLTMRDPALSARHFKVVPDDGYYYVVDLDSTNGTYLNRRRVRAAKLASGDVIQAGQVELEFRSFLGQVA